MNEHKPSKPAAKPSDRKHEEPDFAEADIKIADRVLDELAKAKKSPPPKA